MRDWSRLICEACKLVGEGGGREDWDAAARLLLDKDQLDTVLWARQKFPNPTWDLVDYALTYFCDEIPF